MAEPILPESAIAKLLHGKGRHPYLVAPDGFLFTWAGNVGHYKDSKAVGISPES
jgi:hypothetical protein